MSAKVGAPFTISLVMPVRIWMSGGIERSGSTSVDHSSTSSPSTTRTMATSVTRSPVAEVPVVSRSTKATAGASTALAPALGHAPRRVRELLDEEVDERRHARRAVAAVRVDRVQRQRLHVVDVRE